MAFSGENNSRATQLQHAMWEAFARDPETSTDQAKTYLERMRSHIDALPVTLSNLLGEPLNALTIAQAKHAFFSSLIQGNVHETITIGAFGTLTKVPVDAHNAEAALAGYQNIIQTSETIIHRIDSLRTLWQQTGKTEGGFLKDVCGVNEKTVTLYEAGALSIRGLLTIQPGVILRQYNVK